MSGLIRQIIDSTFWERTWEEAGRMRRNKEGKDNPCTDEAKWDRRAAYFEKRVKGENGSARIQSIMAFLKDEGALFPGMKIVDVGCGNGSISSRLATAVGTGEVWALDPSEKMLALLEEKLKEAGLKNVHALKERWQDVDLEEKGWDRYFDLAFASMSPGIDDAGTLKKLIAASRKYCYLSTFAGRKDKARSEAWQLVSGRPFVKGDLDIIYPFNLLYSWGYRPSLRFFRHYRCEDLPKQDAVEELFEYVRVSLGAGAEARGMVEDYVDRQLQDGFFRYEVEVYNGMMIWDITRGIADY